MNDRYFSLSHFTKVTVAKEEDTRMLIGTEQGLSKVWELQRGRVSNPMRNDSHDMMSFQVLLMTSLHSVKHMVGVFLKKWGISLLICKDIMFCTSIFTVLKIIWIITGTQSRYQSTSSNLSEESLIILFSHGSWRVLGPIRSPGYCTESSINSFITN